jgi:hypothetical protein
MAAALASSRSKEILWPLGGTVLGLIAMPVAIAQYPEFFNNNRYLLPLSVGVVITCWVVPLLIHENAVRILKWSWSGGFAAKVITALSISAIIFGLFFGGRKLFKFHDAHLTAALAPKSSTPVSSSPSETHGTTDKAEATPQRHGTEDKATAKVGHPRETSEVPKAPAESFPAEVKLRFVYPKSPALVIVNSSDSVARDIKWLVALWNMDLPDRNDPLPIPVSTFDWIKPHEEGGPQALFGSPLVSPFLKSGNRLVGSASVDCPTCTRGRTYFVYIVWGEGGWFAEVESEKTGNVIVPKRFLKEFREAYFAQVEAIVPANLRIPIGEP